MILLASRQDIPVVNQATNLRENQVIGLQYYPVRIPLLNPHINLQESPVIFRAESQPVNLQVFLLETLPNHQVDAHLGSLPQSHQTIRLLNQRGIPLGRPQVNPLANQQGILPTDRLVNQQGSQQESLLETHLVDLVFILLDFLPQGLLRSQQGRQQVFQPNRRQ